MAHQRPRALPQQLQQVPTHFVFEKTALLPPHSPAAHFQPHRSRFAWSLSADALRSSSSAAAAWRASLDAATCSTQTHTPAHVLDDCFLCMHACCCLSRLQRHPVPVEGNCCLRAPAAPLVSRCHLCGLYLVLHPAPPALPVGGRVLMQRLLLRQLAGCVATHTHTTTTGGSHTWDGSGAGPAAAVPAQGQSTVTKG